MCDNLALTPPSENGFGLLLKQHRLEKAGCAASGKRCDSSCQSVPMVLRESSYSASFPLQCDRARLNV